VTSDVPQRSSNIGAIENGPFHPFWVTSLKTSDWDDSISEHIESPIARHAPHLNRYAGEPETKVERHYD